MYVCRQIIQNLKFKINLKQIIQTNNQQSELFLFLFILYINFQKLKYSYFASLNHKQQLSSKINPQAFYDLSLFSQEQMNNPSYYFHHKKKSSYYEQEQQKYKESHNKSFQNKYSRSSLDSNQMSYENEQHEGDQQQWEMNEHQGFIKNKVSASKNTHQTKNKLNLKTKMNQANLHKNNNSFFRNKHKVTNNKVGQNNAVYNNQSYSLSSSEQQYNDNDMLINDRSLKINKLSKGTNNKEQLNKNKSLSSPGNKIVLARNAKNKGECSNITHKNISKDIKLTKRSTIKYQHHKPSSHQPSSHQPFSVLPKFKKPQKQKKFSSGSLSTNNTKSKLPTSIKQQKLSGQMIRQQKNLQKSKLSQQSNEFLVLGEQLYDYEDMEKIKTKNYKPFNAQSKNDGNFYERKKKMEEQLLQNGYNTKDKDHRNDQNKKVTFSYYQHGNKKQNFLVNKKNKADSITNSHLNSFSLYDQNKLTKKLTKTIAKIQKYFTTFLYSQTYEQSKSFILSQTSQLPLQTKLQLYHTLLNDQQLLKAIKPQQQKPKFSSQMPTQMDEINNIIKMSIQKIQRKCQSLLELYNEEQSLILKWKNSKLHQLETAKKILENMLSSESRREKKIILKQQNRKNNEKDDINENDDLNSDEEDDQQEDDMMDQQNSPLLILQKQLELIMKQQYYPQMKNQTISLRKTLQQYLKNEHYPLPTQQTQSQATQRNKMQDTNNYFTPNGVLWFFQKFFQFLSNRPNYISYLVQKLNQGFGFDYRTKKLMANDQDILGWSTKFYEGEDILLSQKQIIDQEMFLQFQNTVIKNDPQIKKDMVEYMYYFNKAIINCFNQEFHRYRPFYPHGQPIPYLQKAGKYFQITEDTIFYFFQKCKYHIYTNYITFFAGLILPEGHQESKQTRQYNSTKQIKAVNQQILYDWQIYHCLKPVCKLSLLKQLYEEVQNEIIYQIVKQYRNIDFKKLIGR